MHSNTIASRRRAVAGILCLWLALLAPPAIASLESGAAAFHAHDYATAWKELLPLAEQGNAQAQAYVANMYRAGYGVTRDYAKAVHWYLAAAKQGHASAQYNLGVHYRDGLGVARDPVQATKWFRESALQGFVPAEINLSLCYASGLGVPHDDVRAYAWMYKAAGTGYADAINKLALLRQRLTHEQIMQAIRLAQTLTE